jgi:AcrR family transcriptional regulator
MGRPREFDIEKAVAKASELFWREGYDRTTLTNLTAAMGITPPSFYFAFGSKEKLFKQVFERYITGHMGYFDVAMAEPTARKVVEKLLYAIADSQTDPTKPPGCLGVNNALPHTDEPDGVRTMIASYGESSLEKLRMRFAKAKSDGDLPRSANPSTLAMFIQTLNWGMAVHAQMGATRADLHRTVELALKSWPSDR